MASQVGRIGLNAPGAGGEDAWHRHPLIHPSLARCGMAAAGIHKAHRDKSKHFPMAAGHRRTIGKDISTKFRGNTRPAAASLTTRTQMRETLMHSFPTSHALHAFASCNWMLDVGCCGGAVPSLTREMLDVFRAHPPVTTAANPHQSRGSSSVRDSAGERSGKVKRSLLDLNADRVGGIFRGPGASGGLVRGFLGWRSSPECRPPL